MYCTSCGADVDSSARFCHRCGAASQSGAPQAAPFAAGPGANRGTHIRVLGILWLVESALRLIPGLGLLLLFGAGGAVLTAVLGPMVPAIALLAMPILFGIGLFLFLGAVAGMVAGWGLLRRKPWARTLALILAIVGLPHVPFGTALGLYTLWTLLPEEGEREWREESERAALTPAA
jgi:hypothetical protein